MKDSFKIAIINISLFMLSLGILLFLFNMEDVSGLMAFLFLITMMMVVCTANMVFLIRKNKELQKTAKKYEELSSRLARLSPLGIFIVDSSGDIIDLNEKALSWFYGDKEEVCGKSLFRNVDCSLKQCRNFKTIFFNDMGTHFPAEIHVKRLGREPRESFAVYVDDLTETVQEQDKLMKLANEDALTGLLNRRSFLVELKKEIDRSSRTGLTCSLALIDLDHFKNINDTFGHDFGDEVLKVFASILRENCRSLDILCRYGGEEFVVLLPHTEPDSSLNFLERVRDQFAGHSYSRNVRPTFSCGVTGGILKGDSVDVDRLLKEADALLYRAKEKGRNRIEGSGGRKVGLVRVS